MPHRPLAASLLWLLLITSVAVGAVARELPRRASELPTGGRYTVIEALDDTHLVEFRLDRVTGQTWRFDRHDRRWLTVACEELEPSPSDREPRYQIVAGDRSIWLVDVWGGRTWRHDRLPIDSSQRFAWSTARAGDDIEGWHLVR